MSDGPSHDYEKERYRYCVELREWQERTDKTPPEKCVRCKNSIAEHDRATLCPCYCAGFHVECAKRSLKEKWCFCEGCDDLVHMVFTQPAGSVFGRFQTVKDFQD
jgi:hypothetical protein